jgi:hypothetical protein
MEAHNEGRDGSEFVGLVIGARDLSREWELCLDQSGYVDRVPSLDPAEELKMKRQRAEAGRQWAQCARENGVPSAKDPVPPVADGFATEPLALLPASTTLDQLRVVLAACPLAAHEERAEQGLTQGESKVWVTVPPPGVGFDVAGWDGSGSQPDPNPNQDQLKQEEHLVEMQALIEQSTRAD